MVASNIDVEMLEKKPLIQMSSIKKYQITIWTFVNPNSLPE